MLFAASAPRRERAGSRSPILGGRSKRRSRSISSPTSGSKSVTFFQRSKLSAKPPWQAEFETATRHFAKRARAALRRIAYSRSSAGCSSATSDSRSERSSTRRKIASLVEFWMRSPRHARPIPGCVPRRCFPPSVAPGASILPFVFELTSVVRHTLSIGRRDRPIYPTASLPTTATEGAKEGQCRVADLHATNASNSRRVGPSERAASSGSVLRYAVTLATTSGS